MDVFQFLLSKADGTKVVGGFAKDSLINTYNRQVDGVNMELPPDLITTY